METLDKPEDSSSSEQSTILPEHKNNDIVLPSTNNRYKINQFDVSLAFYTFQLIASNNFDTINIESNVSHITLHPLATNSLTTNQRLPEITVLTSPLTKRTHSDRLSTTPSIANPTTKKPKTRPSKITMGNLKTLVASRPALQPIAESCATPNSSLHNQTPEITNNKMQSSIKVIHSILQQHDARFKEFESLLNENKQLRRDLAQAQELIQQLKEVLTTAAPSVSPAPFVPPGPEDGMEASRCVAVAAKAIPISQPSRQRQRLLKISRHQRSTPAAREAAARNFLPISEIQGFSFIYLHLRGKEPMSTMRMRIRRLKLQSSRILDIHYPTNNIVALLVHNDYYQEAIQILEIQQITCLPNFVSFSKQHLRDSRYNDKSIEERQSAAKAIFHQRLTNIALRVQHDNRKICSDARLPKKSMDYRRTICLHCSSNSISL
ncbi:unnamed protein product [Rhizopus stolonifer]